MDSTQRTASSGDVSLVRGWIIFAAPTALFILVQALRTILSSTVEEVESIFTVGAASFAFASGIYFFFYAPSQLVSGLFVDWVGSRYVLFASGLLCGLSTLIFALGHDFIALATARAISGFASGVPLLVAIYLASIWLPLNRLPLATGLSNGLGALGSFLAVWFLPALIGMSSWATVMFWFTGVWVLFSILMLVMVPRRPEWAMPSGHIPDIRKVLSGVLVVLRIKRFWVLTMIASCNVSPLAILGGLWGARYLELIRGWSHSDASLAAGTVFLGFTVGAILSGFIGQSRVLVRLAAIGAGLVSALATMGLVLLGHYPPTVGIGLMFFVGVGTGFVSLMYALVAIITKPEHRAIGTALILFPTMAGSGITQAISGRIVQTAESKDAHLETAFNMALLFPAALSLVGVLIALLAVIHAILYAKHSESPASH